MRSVELGRNPFPVRQFGLDLASVMARSNTACLRRSR